MKKLLLTLLALAVILPSTIHARYTPNDGYQEKREAFEKGLLKIQDSVKVEKVKKADVLFYEINQKVCNRFEEDVNKLAAIMEEFRTRKGIKETRVAYGQVDTPIKQADYWVNFAAEAIAYQRIQDYTPQISGANLGGSITSSMNNLKYDLGILKGKVQRAKTEVRKALNE